MTTEQELNALRSQLATPTEESPSLAEMNRLAEEIAELRDEEKRLSDLKKEVTEKLEGKESRVSELLIENELKSYKAPAATMTLTFRTSTRQPQGAQVQAWLKHLCDKFGSLQGAVEAGMLTTNSMKLNSYVREQMDLAQEAGEVLNLTQWGLEEPKVNPTLSFRRSR